MARHKPLSTLLFSIIIISTILCALTWQQQTIFDSSPSSSANSFNFNNKEVDSSVLELQSLNQAEAVEKNKTFYVNEVNGTDSGECPDPSQACSSVAYVVDWISHSNDYRITRFLIYLIGDSYKVEQSQFSTLSYTSTFVFLSYNSSNMSTLANKRWLASFSSVEFSDLIIEKVEIFPGNGFSFTDCIVREMSLKRGFTWMTVRNTLIENSIFGDDSTTAYMRNKDERPVIEITNSFVNHSRLNLESITNVINSNFTHSNLTISNSVSSKLQNIQVNNSRINMRVIFFIEIYSLYCYNSQSLFAIDGANEVKIADFNFENCNTYEDSTLLSTVRTLNIGKMNYKRNKGSIRILGVYQTNIQSSKFIENSNGAMHIENHGDSPTYFVLQNCDFLRNTRSSNGGAIYMDSSLANFHIYYSTFEDNIAPNGGALFILSSLRNTYTNTILNRNKATDCSICGSGGALYSNTNSLEWRQSNFTNNVAVKGGAVFIDRVPSITFESPNSLFKNNEAQFGSDFFFQHYKLSNFPLEKYAQSVASSILKSYTIFKNNIEINANQTEFTVYPVYPGEAIELQYSFQDIFGNQLESSHNQPTISSQANVTLYNIFFSNTNFKLFFDLLDRKEISKTIDLVVSYPEFNVISTLHLKVSPCPQYHHLQQINFNGYKCVKQDVEMIIITSVLSFISLLIILPFFSFLLYRFAIKKLCIFYKRERVERRIENQLKDYLFRNINGNGEKHTLLESLTHSNMIIPISDIQIVSKIGEGSNGVVYLGRWNGTDVALKSIKQDSANIENQLEEFEHEASLLASLHHPNVITMYGISFGLNVQYMVVEYLANGSLEKAIHESKMKKKVLSFKDKINIALGIAKGLNYLHSLRPQMIVHRDLKPGNILLDHKFEPKVTDFGMSRFIGTDNSSMTMNIGTLRYCSPETFNNTKTDANHMVDVYSYSMILYELLFEDYPFSDITKKMKSKSSGFSYSSLGSSGASSNSGEVYSIPVRVVKGERPFIPFSNDTEMELWAEEFITDRTTLHNKVEALGGYIELMKHCWNQSPNQRPSFNQISERLSKININFK